MRAGQGPLLALFYVAVALACVQGAAELDAATDLTRPGEGARARMQACLHVTTQLELGPAV